MINDMEDSSYQNLPISGTSSQSQKPAAWASANG
jgi:hypothetical protein